MVSKDGAASWLIPARRASPTPLAGSNAQNPLFLKSRLS